jgi:dipeptidyl aminopeptidase/acylaminoacyl peptidase
LYPGWNANFLNLRRLLTLLFVSSLPCPASAAPKHLFTLDDSSAIAEVSEPSVAPDGMWVAYTVRVDDAKKDERTSDIYMTSWDGARTVRLTSSKEAEQTARFSPDNRWIAFLSNRSGECDLDQIWVMSRAGGEAEKLTDAKGGVSDYVWSPDGKRIAFVAKDPDPDCDEGEKSSSDKKAKKPIVIDRYRFKDDEEGYLDDRRKHLYLLDIATRKTQQLTRGEHDEDLPTWSPDSSLIAFVTKRGDDSDRHENWDLWSIEAHAGGKERQLTTHEDADSEPNLDYDTRPAWSPDGKWIAFLRRGPPKLIYYAVHRLALIPAGVGAYDQGTHAARDPKLTDGTRVLTPDLDRNVSGVHWSPDSAWIYFTIEDDGRSILARMRTTGGAIERFDTGQRDVGSLDVGASGAVALVAGSASEPDEIFALDSGKLRPLSRKNDDLMKTLELASVEELRFRSKDGTEVHGFLTTPPHARAGAMHPAILMIHGGPALQFDRSFHAYWQYFAAHGYTVIAVNPRGSSGRGEAWAKAIYAAWGGKDAEDVLAAVDHVVQKKLADPARLGVAGWSYGGILTNYVIARDHRFKAAVSGASISDILAGYGTDMYVREYELELGPPWKTTDVWLQLSSPFLHADRIVTPTLFLCGDKDFNVPLSNSEQMYQALRSLGVPTRLVIYPGEAHELKRPSYIKDALERHLAWFDKHLSAATASRAARTP